MTTALRAGPPGVLAALRRADARVGDLAALAFGIGALATQRVAVGALGVDGPAAGVRAGAIFLATAAVAVFALHFRRYRGAWLVCAGIAMNLAAMTANGGMMPVAFELVHGRFAQVSEADIGRQVRGSKDVVLLADDVNLRIFSDRYLVKAPGLGDNVYSLGDFVLFTGLALAAVEGVAGAVAPRRRAVRDRAAQ